MQEQDWKLKLRYGKTITPYKHFTVLAAGQVIKLTDGFDCPEGNAFMGMKVWAESTAQSADVFQTIATQIGFVITDDIQVYETDPEEPPGENPSGYDIRFTPF